MGSIHRIAAQQEREELERWHGQRGRDGQERCGHEDINGEKLQLSETREAFITAVLPLQCSTV